MTAKALLGSTVIHLILAFIAGMIFSDHFRVTLFPPSIQFKDDTHLHQQIAELQVQQDSLLLQNTIGEGVIANLEELIFKKSDTIDSLQLVIITIRNQSRRRSSSIDSIIAVDSTNAVGQYRIALEGLGVVPDLTEHLTFGEIGHGAKFLSDYQGMQLELWLTSNAYDQLKGMYDLRQQAFDELQKINDNNKLIIANETQQKDEWKQAYEDETGWWKDRFIFGLGYGGQFSFNNDQVTHGIQAGFYIKLFGI